MHRYLFAFLLLSFSLCAHSQIRIQNGSFEGDTGYTYPTGWNRCNFGEFWGGGTIPFNNWTTPSYDGNTYVCFNYHASQMIDSMSQRISCPLIQGKTHKFNVALLSLYDGSTIGAYGHGYLKIYGSSYACGTEQLLWQSPVVSNQWSLYEGEFTPDSAWRYITLMPWSNNGIDVGLGIDAMSDIAVHDNYIFLAIDTIQTVNNNCYTLKAKSDIGGVNYNWHSVPVLQFEDDSTQQVCISEDTWVYVDLLGGCDVYRDSVLLKYKGASTGINTNEDLFKATVYPNPASQFFAINYSSVVAIESIQLVNTMGQVVAVHKPSGGYEKFEVQGLASCVYFH